MADHKNFFETVQEAEMRLSGGVVLYEGDPYIVSSISDHKKDGIFRIYLAPFGKSDGRIPQEFYQQTNQLLSKWLDAWLETDDGKKSGWLRKSMDSPHFNKFRPFDLGMCNYGGKAAFIERHPQRRTLQALTINSVTETVVSLGDPISSGLRVAWGGQSFIDMIKGVYPSAEECLKNLLDPDNKNISVAFHRNFAFIKGPLKLLFLAFKTKVIGLLPEKSLDTIQISGEFNHYKEVTQELGIFKKVEVMR